MKLRDYIGKSILSVTEVGGIMEGDTDNIAEWSNDLIIKFLNIY